MTIGAAVAAVSTGVFVVSLAWLVARPRRRLADRVRPYALVPLTTLGRPADERSVRMASGTADARAGLAGWVRRAVEAALLSGEPDEALRRRLAQSGLHDVTADRLVTEHRVQQVLAGTAGVVVAGLVAVATGMAGPTALGLCLLGLVWGVARPGKAVDRAVAARRARLRAELPPVAQLLAMRVRAGGSVVSAVAATADRCQGLLAEELHDALAQHRAGRPLEEALDGLAAQTAEPEVARLHRLLAGTIRYGLDAAPELLRLAREGRERHLTRLRRDATRRRAALLLPTIGLLAPLMLLFVAAPLPGLIGG